MVEFDDERAVALIWVEEGLRLDGEISEKAAVALAPFVDAILGQLEYEVVNGWASPAQPLTLPA